MKIEIYGAERSVLKDCLRCGEKELIGELSTALTESYKELCNKKLAIIEKIYRSIES